MCFISGIHYSGTFECSEKLTHVSFYFLSSFFIFIFSNFVFLISSLLLDPSQSRGERTISSLKVSCCLFVSLAAILFILLFTYFLCFALAFNKDISK